MMLERAVSRRAQGRNLADHQFVQGMIADSAIELEQFRLLVLKTAWIIDTQPHGAARTHIAMCKVQMAKIYHDIVQRAIQVHGSLGVTLETPLADMWMGLPSLALADGPTDRGAQGPSREGFPARRETAARPLPERAHPDPARSRASALRAGAVGMIDDIVDASWRP